MPTAPHARRLHARRLRSSAPARHEVGAGELRERTREAKRGCGRAPARVGWVAVVVGVGEGRPRGDEELGCVDSAAGGGARAAARAPCHGSGGARRGRGAECEAVAPSACCAGAPGGGERRGKCSVCSGEWLQRGGGSWEAEHRSPRPHLSRPRAVAIRTAPAPSPRSSRERRVGRRPSHRSSSRPRSARCQGLGARWVPLREGESAGLLSGREDVGALRLAAPGCGANSNLDRLPRGGWGVKGRRGVEVVARLQSRPADGAWEHGGRG